MIRKWICFCCLFFLTGCSTMVREESIASTTTQIITDEQQYDSFVSSMNEIFDRLKKENYTYYASLSSQKPIAYWQSKIETLFQEQGYTFPTAFYEECETNFAQVLAQSEDNIFRSYAEVNGSLVYEYNLYGSKQELSYTISVSNQDVQVVTMPEAYTNFIESDELSIVNYAATDKGFSITYRNDVGRDNNNGNSRMATFYVQNGKIQKLSIQTLQNIATVPSKATEDTQWRILLDKIGMNVQEQSELLDLYQHLSLDVTRNRTQKNVIGNFEVYAVVLNPHDVIAKGLYISRIK